MAENTTSWFRVLLLLVVFIGHFSVKQFGYVQTTGYWVMSDFYLYKNWENRSSHWYSQWETLRGPHDQTRFRLKKYFSLHLRYKAKAILLISTIHIRHRQYLVLVLRYWCFGQYWYWYWYWKSQISKYWYWYWYWKTDSAGIGIGIGIDLKKHSFPKLQQIYKRDIKPSRWKISFNP